jgi:hypothetical protein
MKKNQTFFIKKIATYLSLGLFERRQRYRRRLHPSKENILHCLHILWAIFAFGCGSRSSLTKDPGGSESTTQILNDEFWKRKVYSSYLEALRDPELLRAGVLHPECTLCIS